MNYNSSCIPENTVAVISTPNSTTCACHRGYYDPICSSHHDWYSTILTIVFATETVALACAFVWIAARVRHLVRHKKRGYSHLASIAIGANFLACLMRLVYLWMPSRSILGMVEPPYTTTIQVILVHGAVSVWVMTTALLMGFWNDVLAKVGSKTIGCRSNVIVIVLSLVTLLCSVTGMLIVITSPLGAVGISLVFVPLLLLMGVIIYHTIGVRRGTITLSGKNRQKAQWALRWFVVLGIFWMLYIIALITASIVAQLPAEPVKVIPEIMYRLIECGIMLTIMAILDYEFISLRGVISVIRGSSKTLVTPSATPDTAYTTGSGVQSSKPEDV